MKSFVLLLLSTLAVFGQVPSLKSFNPAQFNTNNFIVSIKDGATLTNITIRNSLTLPSLPDSTITLNGVTITNWTDIGPVETNSLWIEIAGVLQPLVGNQVLVTNLSSQNVLSALGALTMPASYSTNLVAGTNCLNPYNLGSVWITGADATAAGSSISLVSGNGQGQLLILQNYSTNSGFTMYNGIPFCDGSGGFIRLNGDWATTNRGDTLFLYNTGQIWTEVGRSYSSTNIINGDNVWVNDAGNIHPVFANTNNELSFTTTSTRANGDSLFTLQNNATNLFVVNGRGMSLYGYSTQTDDILHGYLDGTEAMELTKNVELDLYGQSAGRGQFAVSVPGLTTSVSILSGFLGTTADQASIGTPIRYSPPLTLTGSAWDTDDAVPRAQTMIALVKPADGNDTSGSLSINMGISGSTAEVFTLSSNSGYTGTGTKAFYDDGTFKTASGGDTIWTVDAGHIYPINGNTNNVLTFTSGLADNATNVAMVVGTTNYWSASGSLLARFDNGGTNNLSIGPFGGIYSGRNTLADFGSFNRLGLFAESFEDFGDATSSSVYLQRGDSGYNYYSTAEMTVAGTIGNTTSILRLIDALSANRAEMHVETNNIYVDLQVNNQSKFKANPTVASSGSAASYLFDTSNTLTNGDKLVSIGNAGVEQLRVANNGGIYLGEGAYDWEGSISPTIAVVSQADVYGNDGSAGFVFEALNNTSSINADTHNQFVGSIATNLLSLVLRNQTSGNLTVLNPLIVDTNNPMPYIFDTKNPITSTNGLLASFRNAGTRYLDIDKTGVVLFGPGTTNAIYRSGNDLIYTNGTTSALYFMVKSGADATAVGKFGVSSGGHATVAADTGRNVLLSPDGALYTASSSSFAPGANGTLDLGAQANQWQNLFLASKIVWNGTTNSVYDLAGSGSPEGVVTASPGSTYRNFSGGSLTTFWVKESGTGNTGWIGK